MSPDRSGDTAGGPRSVPPAIADCPTNFSLSMSPERSADMALRPSTTPRSVDPPPSIPCSATQAPSRNKLSRSTFASMMLCGINAVGCGTSDLAPDQSHDPAKETDNDEQWISLPSPPAQDKPARPMRSYPPAAPDRSIRINGNTPTTLTYPRADATQATAPAANALSVPPSTPSRHPADRR